MSKKLNFYQILQVNPEAEETVIRHSFRYLAGKYHPDNSDTGSKEKFDQIVEAWKILSDKNRRSEYDASLKETGQHCRKN